MKDPEFLIPSEEIVPPAPPSTPDEITPPGSDAGEAAEHAPLPPEFAPPGKGGTVPERDKKASFNLSALLTAALAVALVATVTPLFFNTQAVTNVVYGVAPGLTPGGTDPGETETVPAETAEQITDPYAVTAFPDLPNRNPDFAGDYAWAGKGVENSEEFLILTTGSGERTYMVAGGYYRDKGIIESNGSGFHYDRASNVLTLTDFNDPTAQLSGNLMGNGFTIRLVGTNQLGQIHFWGAMYGGSITFTGNGSLTVNESAGAALGIWIEAENSPSCVMVDNGVTLDIYGSQTAFAVQNSTIDAGLYYLAPLWIKGGVPARGTLDDNGAFLSDEAGFLFTVVDGEGQMAQHVILSLEPPEEDK